MDFRRIVRVSAIGIGVLLLGLALALGAWPSGPPDAEVASAPAERPEAEGSEPEEPESSDDLADDALADLVEGEDDLVLTEEDLAETPVSDAGLAGLGALSDAWPEARDPFRRAVPRTLARYHRKVQRGRRLSTRERRALVQMQRALPDDPRPSLVLAHHFVDIVYFSDALERYNQAMTIDPSARGDRRMLGDLIRMAQSPLVAERASDIIVHVYGPQAIDEVEREMRREPDPVRVGMLTSLRSRLPSGGE
jgi:hypothetical protein